MRYLASVDFSASDLEWLVRSPRRFFAFSGSDVPCFVVAARYAVPAQSPTQTADDRGDRASDRNPDGGEIGHVRALTLLRFVRAITAAVGLVVLGTGGWAILTQSSDTQWPSGVHCCHSFKWPVTVRESPRNGDVFGRPPDHPDHTEVFSRIRKKKSGNSWIDPLDGRLRNHVGHN